MTLKEQIKLDFMTAYKAKEMDKKNFLGVLKGSIETQEGKGIESTDENVLKAIKSLEKGLIENIEGGKKMGLDVSKEETELSFLKPYLPELMDEKTIRDNVQLIIVESGEKNAGKIIGLFNKEFRGLADNKIVGRIIQEELV